MQDYIFSVTVFRILTRVFLLRKLHIYTYKLKTKCSNFFFSDMEKVQHTGSSAELPARKLPNKLHQSGLWTRICGLRGKI